MHLEGTCLPQHPHLGPLGVAAHDRVVDHDDPTAPDHVLQRVELQPDAELAQGLAGLDEGPADVGVLHEALAERDAALLGVPGGCRRARLGHRHHQVGLDGELARQLATHLDASLVDAPTGDPRIGSGQVDVLEDASLGLRLGEGVRAQALVVDHDHLARLDLADDTGADRRQRGVLAGHHPATVEPAQHERPDALGVAGGVERVLVHPDQGERALEHREHLERTLLQAGVGVVGQQRRSPARCRWSTTRGHARGCRARRSRSAGRRRPGRGRGC